jgi:hypothetical protein
VTSQPHRRRSDLLQTRVPNIWATKTLYYYVIDEVIFCRQLLHCIGSCGTAFSVIGRCKDAHYWRLSALFLSHYSSDLEIVNYTYETMHLISRRLLIAVDHVPQGRQGELSNLWMHFTPLYRGFYRDDPVQKAICCVHYAFQCTHKYSQRDFVSGRMQNGHTHVERDNGSDFGEKGKLGATALSGLNLQRFQDLS